MVEAAARHGVAARCVWLDTPLAQAQVNLVERLLERFGSLPTPDELRELAKQEQGVLAPTSQMRAFRELEPPATDEGFAAWSMCRSSARRRPGRAGVFVAAAALLDGWERALADRARRASPRVRLEPGRQPDALAAAAARLAGQVSGPVESALCPHPAGPPTCWCRPPLPGLPLAFARPTASTRRARSRRHEPAHRTLATALGAHYVAV